jgi:antitoxin component YwqK of YwqJK toxin-antitoxin module
MGGKGMALGALLLASCAMNNARDFYVKGKKLASARYDAATNTWSLQGFDEEGNLRYASKYQSLMKGDANAGLEIPGSKTEYDAKGKIISSWRFSPDSTRAVYTKPVYPFIKMRMETIFKKAVVESVIIRDDTGAVSLAARYGGERYFFLSFQYLAMSAYVPFAPAQKAPYAYDTLMSETFNLPGKGLLRSEFRTKDTIIEKSFFKSGAPTRVSVCSPRRDSTCAHALVNEWYENGNPKIQQEYLGGNRYRHRHFYGNGKPMTEANYLLTKLDGKYQSWWESGKPDRIIEYENGKEISSQEWDAEGKLME